MKTLLLILLLVLFALPSYSQNNITNTLGTSGVFTIKDASANYLTLSQSTGQVNILKTLRLENTTSSTTGVLFKGDTRFIHNYGTDNTFVGINAGNFIMTGIGNTALGMSSLFYNITGNYNTALGTGSLVTNYTGYENKAVGFHSLYTNAEGFCNTALGFMSLNTNNGFYNTALGHQSLYSNTTGSWNTAAGRYSLYYNTLGYDNTAIGDQSLYYNIEGVQNTALGRLSLQSNNYGSYNTAIGNFALYSTTQGNYNTAVGFHSGTSITTGSNLTMVGYNAQPTDVNTSNQITLGDTYVTSLRCAVTTITSISDARDKKNISDLSLGLDFITKLKPRIFNWDKREWYEGNISDGSKMKESPTAGFIAQELDDAQINANAEWLNLVLKDNPEKWEATPGNLLPIVVKAIQDLKSENDELKSENTELKDRLLKLEQMQNMLAIEIKNMKSKDENLLQVQNNK